MSSELSLLVELYNPLYLFPIIGVVFTALMVFAFGFKSSTQPSNEVFDVLNDRHHKNYKTQETVKKKKQNKITTAKSETKSEINGHVNSGSVKVTEEKTPKKSVVKPKSVTSVTNNNIKSTKKVSKNKKSEESVNREEVDDKDSGEWVELISKKERKNRKQKEEQLLVESQEVLNYKNNKKEKTSPKNDKKEPKKSKENKSHKNIGLDSNSILESKEAENVVKTENEKNDNSVINEVVVNSEELVAEEPDIYELAKEQRVPKKSQKHGKQKRGSESEAAIKVDALPESEPKTNLDLKDKLTASIVANYEASDHNKPDLTSNANNKKKKDKNKKKPSQTPQTLQTKTEDNNESNGNNNLIPVIESEVEKSENGVNALDIPNEVKPIEEEEFKSVTKKRRARRE